MPAFAAVTLAMLGFKLVAVKPLGPLQLRGEGVVPPFKLNVPPMHIGLLLVGFGAAGVAVTFQLKVLKFPKLQPATPTATLLVLI